MAISSNRIPLQRKGLLRRSSMSCSGVIVTVIVVLLLQAAIFQVLSIFGEDFYMTLSSYPELEAVLTSSAQNQSLGEQSKASLPNSQSHQLASEHSFGFFNDIPDDQWLRAQEIHSKMFPNFYKDLYAFSSKEKSRDLKQLDRSKDWNGANFQEEFHCPLAQRLPPDSMADGPKWVCDPHRLRNVSDCLIYSFGSNGKAEFEKGVRDEIGPNCEIHTFDPKGYNKRNGNFANALKGYATFHQWGLGTAEEEARNPNKFKTLQSIMKELGHVGRTVHIFKIDCEWCEWFTYDQWLKEDLRQILVETHNAPMPYAQHFFFNLHDHGYAIFSKEANYINGAGGVEFAFLKLHNDFFENKFYKDFNSSKKG